MLFRQKGENESAVGPQGCGHGGAVDLVLYLSGTIVTITILRRNLLHETSVKLERAPTNWFRSIPRIAAVNDAIPL